MKHSPTFCRVHVNTCVLFWQFVIVKASHKVPSTVPGASEVMDYSWEMEEGDAVPIVCLVSPRAWQGQLHQVNRKSCYASRVHDSEWSLVMDVGD